MQYASYGHRGGRIGPPEAPVGWDNSNYWAGVYARRIARESFAAILRLPLPRDVRRRIIREWRAANLHLIQRANQWRALYRR